MLSMNSIRDDGWAQRGGIDRLIVLASGKQVLVDEKVRYKEYDDIALEYWSSRERKIPGWVAKDLACDYIAYAFVNSQRCYLLPFLQLRKAWAEHHRQWVGRFPKVEAANDGYTTVSVAVPIDTLMRAIQSTLLVRWVDEEWLAEYGEEDAP